jgi:YVTN family beta-propeller protein
MRRPAALTITSLAAAGLLAGALVTVPASASGTSDGTPDAGQQEQEALGAQGAPEAPRQARARTGKRTVMVVGNNWEGTATIVDAATHRRLKKIDIIPDIDEEMAEIWTSPDRAAFYLAVQQGVGEGNDQYVDDMFTTRDGRYLAVSRPSLSDVVWIDLRKAAAGRSDSIVAEQQMDGYRTDHMGVSPDGRRLIVSDSTERQVVEFSMVDERLGNGDRVRMGDRLRSFESGDTPHENNYFADGKRIFHASIGRVYTAPDQDLPAPIPDDFVHDTVKADRWMQIVRTRDFSVAKRWDMGLELEEAGYPDMSSAVRPAVLTPDETTIYLQVSFFHGIVEFRLDRPDLPRGLDYETAPGPGATSGTTMPEPRTGRVTRLIPLPNYVQDLPREQYVLDSAHHGIAMNHSGRKLCVAGTMSDYAAIVDRATWSPKIFRGAARFLRDREYSKPYWATEGPGNTCWMSMSGSDLVTVIDFRTEKVVAEVPVGRHPQRVREGRIRERVVATF